MDECLSSENDENVPDTSSLTTVEPELLKEEQALLPDSSDSDGSSNYAETRIRNNNWCSCGGVVTVDQSKRILRACVVVIRKKFRMNFSTESFNII